jgi:hypothetical protein
LAESVGTLGNNSAILPNRIRPFCRNGFCIVWHSICEFDVQNTI